MLLGGGGLTVTVPGGGITDVAEGHPPGHEVTVIVEVVDEIEM